MIVINKMHLQEADLLRVLAMLEAASMGKAIVCSDIPVFDEVFSDTEVSRFKNDDADSLKMAVERAILEKGILGENAKARFDKDYSAENFYNRHIEIYNDMIYSKPIILICDHFQYYENTTPSIY